ncbi:MAG: hypothetical protein ACRCT8_05985 [Lacipirellulaceae bacterium]
MKLHSLLRCVAACGPLALAAAPAPALNMIFVNDNFDSYADQAAFEAAWPARAGDGFLAPPGPGGNLVDSGSGPAGITGKGAAGPSGLINEHGGGYDPVINTSGYRIQPSATQDVVVRGDMFADTATGPTIRQTIGLRSDRFDRNPDPAVTDFGVNLVELGFWNSTGACIPTDADNLCSGGSPGDPNADPPVPPVPADPEFRPETDFAFRLQLFSFASLGDYIENGVNRGQMLRNPDWQFFPLDPALDLVANVKPNGTAGNGSGAVSFADIGDGWHTFDATIGETKTVLTLDLFRDGINNATGLAGVDSTVEIEISMAENFNNPPFKFNPSPMNSLRIGSPSGVASASGVSTFDNLYLALEDKAVAVVGDYTGDGKVNAADYTVYRDTLGSTTDLRADGNGNSVIDAGDYGVWVANYGTGAAAATAIPEPAALVALASGLLAASVGRRRV